MCDYGYAEAEKVSLFGLELLLWNLSDPLFMKYSTYQYEFGEIVRYSANNLFIDTMKGSFGKSILRLYYIRFGVKNYAR